jgi:Domain of unknown function (DUF3291)
MLGIEATMPIISITRLHVRRWRYLPPFVLSVLRINRQVERSPGFIEGLLSAAPPFEFWTLTAWRSESDMRSFRNAAAHAEAMKKLLEWCDEASYAHWEHGSDVLPSMQEAIEKLRSGGRLSKVRHPSPRQQRGDLVGSRVPRPGQRLRSRGAAVAV